MDDDNHLSYENKEKTIKTPIKFTGNLDADKIIASNIDDKDLLNFCLSSKFAFCLDQNFWKQRFFSKYNFFPSNVPNWKKLYLKFIYYTDKFKKINAYDDKIWGADFAIKNAVEKEEKYITDALKHFHYLYLKADFDSVLSGKKRFFEFYGSGNSADLNYSAQKFLINGKIVFKSITKVYIFDEKYKTANGLEAKKIAESILEIYGEFKDTIELIWYGKTIGILCMVEDGSYAIEYEEGELKLYAWAETKELAEEIMEKLHNTEILKFCQLNTKKTYKTGPVILRKR